MLDRIVSVASMDNHESIMGLGVAGSVHSVLVQCSPKLFEVCVCVCGWVGGGGVAFCCVFRSHSVFEAVMHYLLGMKLVRDVSVITYLSSARAPPPY